MSKHHDTGGSVPFYSHHTRRMSRRKLAAKRTKRLSFQPDFHDLEKRMMPATFLVLNTADSGAGSLRQAILDSNATPGSNTIDFSIDSGPQTITPGSNLPIIRVPVNIDATSQPGYAGVPLIEFNAIHASDPFQLLAGSDGSAVRGFVINNYFDQAIEIETDGNLVEGCYIGTNATGTAAPTSSTYGIEVLSANNTIGGTGAGEGNLISNNYIAGIYITNVGGAHGNLVEGNRIGTDVSGTTAIQNYSGITIIKSADNTIGGTSAGAGNLISGNYGNGIDISVYGASGNIIQGNQIGTDVSGTIALPNTIGIEIHNFENSPIATTIGGTSPAAANVISGNSTFGIDLSNVSAVEVVGNVIGTNRSGTAAIANGTGVYIESGATGDTIGGTAAGTSNLISGNAGPDQTSGYGVFIDGYGVEGNLVEGNQIGTDSSGTSPIANAIAGIRINYGDSNTIGGAIAAAQI